MSSSFHDLQQKRCTTKKRCNEFNFLLGLYEHKLKYKKLLYLVFSNFYGSLMVILLIGRYYKKWSENIESLDLLKFKPSTVTSMIYQGSFNR